MIRLIAIVVAALPLSAPAQEHLNDRQLLGMRLFNQSAGEPVKVVLPYFRARKIAVMTLRD